MARKITDEDLANRGVMGLPDVPGLTAIEMQKKLEEIPREVIIPRYNELVDSVADICDEFSKLSTYDVGDYCIYENVLYKCTTAITTEGEWDATKWKATSIDKELKEISSYTENKDVISDKYDSSKTYSVGDYCIYDDTLYKCKTEITSAEEFDSSKWEPTNCGKEFEVLNSNLSELQSVDITPVSNNYAAVNTSGTYAYIKNGICYLQITINCTASYSSWANIAKLQIQLDTGGKELYFPAIDTSAQKAHSVVRIIGDGKVYCMPTSGAALFANVSFPCKLIAN